MMLEYVDEGLDFRRQMMPVRIDGVQRHLDRPVLGQQANEPTGFEIVPNEKTRHQADGTAFQRHLPQGLTAVGDEAAGNPYRCRRALAIEKAPIVAEGIVQMAPAIVRGELIELLHAAMLFEIIVRAA